MHTSKGQITSQKPKQYVPIKVISSERAENTIPGLGWVTFPREAELACLFTVLSTLTFQKIQITQTDIFSGSQQPDTHFHDPQEASSISGIVLGEYVAHTGGTSPWVFKSNYRPMLGFVGWTNLLWSSVATHKQQLGWAAICGNAGCFAAVGSTKLFCQFPLFWVFLSKKKKASVLLHTKHNES